MRPNDTTNISLIARAARWQGLADATLSTWRAKEEPRWSSISGTRISKEIATLSSTKKTTRHLMKYWRHRSTIVRATKRMTSLRSLLTIGARYMTLFTLDNKPRWIVEAKISTRIRMTKTFCWMRLMHRTTSKIICKSYGRKGLGRLNKSLTSLRGFIWTPGLTSMLSCAVKSAISLTSVTRTKKTKITRQTRASIHPSTAGQGEKRASLTHRSNRKL